MSTVTIGRETTSGKLQAFTAGSGEFHAWLVAVPEVSPEHYRLHVTSHDQAVIDALRSKCETLDELPTVIDEALVTASQKN